jgi:hypothetical protein
MARGQRSGIILSANDASTVLGMAHRGDRDHDIAAWFGVNQGRVAEVKDGTKHAGAVAVPANQLPPRGPPGLKGRRLREAVRRALVLLNRAGNAPRDVVAVLRDAERDYDANER